MYIRFRLQVLFPHMLNRGCLSVVFFPVLPFVVYVSFFSLIYRKLVVTVDLQGRESDL
jgi:hypothetical protein